MMKWQMITCTLPLIAQRPYQSTTKPTPLGYHLPKTHHNCTPAKSLFLQEHSETKQFYSCVILWTTWVAHNRWTHNGTTLLQPAEIDKIIKLELKRYVRGQLERINMLSPGNHEKKSQTSQPTQQNTTNMAFLTL